VTSSVIVLSYRPGRWLEPCLASVLIQADEVLLVDNGSPNGEALSIGRRAGATVIRSATNLGFTGGVNLGLRRASGDLVALLNDDAVAGAGWLAGAERVLADPGVAAVAPKVVLSGSYREVAFADPEWFSPGDARPLGRRLDTVTVAGNEVLDRIVGAGVHRLEHGPQADYPPSWRWTAGPRPFYVPLPDDETSAEVLVNGEPPPAGPVCRLVDTAGVFLRMDGYAGDHGFAAPDDGRFDRPAERFALSGAALVARAETFRRIGPLADPFFAYYEDIDWCWRARLAGLRVLYDPSATVDHLHSATSGGATDPAVRVMAERNRTLTLVRNGPRSEVVRAVRKRMADGPDGGVRRAIVRMLPWALGTRLRRSRSWATSPQDVWNRWAGADASWDESPHRSGAAPGRIPGPA